MKTINLIKILSILVLYTSCVTKIPINKNFYGQTKVGIVLKVDSINTFRSGAQGLLDYAITQQIKYKKPLKTIESFVEPTSKIKTAIKQILAKKKKQFQYLNLVYNKNDYKKFKRLNNADNTGYFKRNIRLLKEKYGVDEIMFIHVQYGLMINYYSMIETGRTGQSYIKTTIVRLNDNLILLQDNTNVLKEIKGKWKTPPNYENLQTAINEAINTSIQQYKTKF